MVKTTLILFFDSNGVIHHEYVPEAQTVNATFCIQVLDRLCKCIACVRPEMWRYWKFFLLHNNAHSHTAAIVQQFLAKKGVARSNHPIFTRFLSTRLFRFLKIKIGAERWPLCFDRRHSEICNLEIKSLPNFWLRGSKIAPSLFKCQETISNKYYLFEFIAFFFSFRSVVTELTRPTL